MHATTNCLLSLHPLILLSTYCTHCSTVAKLCFRMPRISLFLFASFAQVFPEMLYLINMGEGRRSLRVSRKTHNQCVCSMPNHGSETGSPLSNKNGYPNPNPNHYQRYQSRLLFSNTNISCVPIKIRATIVKKL